ncbi:YbaB/EbfC family nucleoid-associated protein [Nocardia tengchongensis]|uniref:YbaB/EbfC family nucleoid-associated protein n=1 Tax=Nocardia tengchongensis TaxID=2055889 RepID=UPI0036B09BD5
MTAEMDALLQGVTDKLEVLEATLHGLGAVRGHCAAADGSVTAEVDAEGALTALWLAESVTARAPAEVSRLILWATQRAAADATAQRARIIARLNNALSPISENVGGDPDSA